MSEATLLQQTLEANKNYLAGSPRFLDSSGAPYLVVACIDARLTGMLEPALGLARGRAAVVRTAGNRITEQCAESLRAVAVALFLKGASDIFIVGHTDCAMSHFSAAEVVESFRRVGIARTAFGDEDLRTWFGAFSEIRANVVDSVQSLRQSGLVPAHCRVHGLIIDSVSGNVEVVVDGDVAAPPQPSPRDRTPAAGEATARKEQEIEGRSPVAAPESLPPIPKSGAHPLRKPIVIEGDSKAAGAPQPPGAPMTYVDAMLQIRKVVEAARRNPALRRALTDLAATVDREPDPVRVFSALEHLERECKALYPEIVPAVQVMRSAVRNRKGGLNFMEMMRRVLE